jgi:hypothetical protein
MSNPTWPVYVFQTTLKAPQLNSWLVPYMTQPDGNETVAESVTIPKTFTSWIPGMLPGPNVAGPNGYVFTAYGEQATYLKKTYANGSPDDLLKIIG